MNQSQQTSKIKNKYATQLNQLRIQSTADQTQALASIISQIFSDEYIFVNKSFRKKIKSNNKGYIHIKELLNIAEIVEYFKIIGFQSIKQQLSFLKATIKHYCYMFLHLNQPKVRRILPFDHKLYKDIKPICIQKIEEQQSVSDIRQWFGDQCFTQAKSLNSYDRTNNNLIYSSTYRQRLENPQSMIHNAPFKVLTYGQVCRQRQRQSRLWFNQQYKEYQTLRYQKINHKQNNNMLIAYNIQEKSHYSNQQNEQLKIINEREQLLFQQLIKQPNPQFNQSLSIFIQQNYPSHPY